MKKTAKTTTQPGGNPDRRFFYLEILTGILGAGMIIFMIFYFNTKHEIASERSINKFREENPGIKLIREDSNKLVHPLLLVVVDKESTRYAALKDKLAATIHQWQQKNTIQKVSVYFKNLQDATWMGIEPDQAFMPGSLIKVPIMIYFLMEEEKHAGVLTKKLFFEKPKHYFPSQEIKGDSILPGREYEISELLRYMIVDSDNNATNLLSRELKSDEFRKLFNDLEIPPDEINDISYEISPRAYSRFFRVLYNATYLEPKLSEYGMELLVQSKFRNGIAKKLPAGTIVASKFGERGINDLMDFSESAIVYKGTQPYSLTIMTRGTSAEQQTELISELSEEVFSSLN